MGKQKCPECPKCLPGWLVQFGDLMSLLLCFFILLLSMATMDKKKVEEYFDIMRRSFGFLEGAEDTSQATKEKLAKENMDASDAGNQNDIGAGNENGEIIEEIEEIANEFNEQTKAEETEEVVINVKNNNEFVIEIPATLLFANAQYKIEDIQARRFLRKISRIVRTLGNSLDIEIIGHASSFEIDGGDNIPRNSWDISALRSISIVQEFIKNRIEPARLKVSAFGSYRPKSDLSKDNRRVELRFITSNYDTDELGSDNFFDRIK